MSPNASHRPPQPPHEPDATIAVVIPAYNAEDTVGRALESVLRQTRPADEILVVDDGSDDETAARARAVSPRVRVLSGEHRGPGAARQLGTVTASSDYVAYLDDDDRWLPEKLERFAAVVRAFDRPAFVFSDFRRYVEDLDELKPATNHEIFAWAADVPHQVRPLDDGTATLHFDPPSALEALLRGYPIWPSTALALRSAVLEAGGWDTRFPRCQDLDLWLRMSVDTGMVFLDSALTIVHVHERHGRARDWVLRQMEWDLRVLDHHAGEGAFFSPERKRRIRHHWGLRTVYTGDMSRQYGERLQAVRWYLKATLRPGGRLRGLARLLETGTGLDLLRDRLGGAGSD